MDAADLPDSFDDLTRLPRHSKVDFDDYFESEKHVANLGT
jgi:hypothetical protein